MVSPWSGSVEPAPVKFTESGTEPVCGVPTADTVTTLYGLIDFDVQYFDTSTNSWVTAPGGAIRGNNKVVTAITGLNVTTSKIRVNVLNARDHYSRIVEVEAYGCGAQ